MPQITRLIRRIPTGGRRIKSPPPDFDSISRRFPLPEISVEGELPLPLPNKADHPAPVTETNREHVHNIHRTGTTSENHIKTLKQVNQCQPQTDSVQQHVGTVGTVPREHIHHSTTHTLASLVDRAFANGYVPDYYVLVKSMPKEDHVAQRQLRHACPNFAWPVL